MKLINFRIVHVLLAVLVVALVVASLVERQAVIGQSSTRSPDGSWCLDLKLVQHSTLFHSRKVLDSRIKHITNPDWNVGASIPLNDADAKTISNEHPEHPIVWSKDTCKVSYWINEQMEDSIEIETEGGQFRYQRDLYDTSVTYTDKQNAK